VHSSEDDNVSDPSGGSGSRVACGVIETRLAGLPRTGGAPAPMALAGVGAGLVALSAIWRRGRRS
jgi:hypothetical protein